MYWPDPANEIIDSAKFVGSDRKVIVQRVLISGFITLLDDFIFYPYLTFCLQLCLGRSGDLLTSTFAFARKFSRLKSSRNDTAVCMATKEFTFTILPISMVTSRE